MVIPIITSLSRQVFSQAPQGEREGAYALGATRWGMIRTVVLPFGRGGVIGACMLGIGRALGETIAVTLIVSATFHFNYHVLETGGNSIASTIANEYSSFPDAGSMGLSALMAAGLVLFGMTLIVNTLGAIVIGRSRSGHGHRLTRWPHWNRPPARCDDRRQRPATDAPLRSGRSPPKTR